MSRLGGAALAVVALAACCDEPAAVLGLQAKAASFDGEALEPQSRGAWRRLSEVTYYGSTTDVRTWGPVEPASDAVTLWHAEERDALAHLALNAAPGGRLWALRALKELDPGLFEQLAPGFRADATVVTESNGCIAGDSAVGALFEGLQQDDGLRREYDRRFGRPGEPGSALEWSRDARASGHWMLGSDEARAAVLRLDAATWISDGSCARGRDLDLLLEHESYPGRAACMLAVSPNPAARFFGAQALRQLAPTTFAELTPFWERDPTPVPCRSHLLTREHTLAEALATHGG